MKDVNFGNNHGVRHAYAYGHTKKLAAEGFKDAIKTAEDKPTVAKSFKDIIASTQVTPENKVVPQTTEE